MQYLKRMTFHIVIIPHRGLPPTLPQLTLSFALQAFPRTAVVLVAISEMHQRLHQCLMRMQKTIIMDYTVELLHIAAELCPTE